MCKLWVIFTAVILLSACGNGEQTAEPAPPTEEAASQSNTKVIALNGRSYRLAFPASGFDNNKMYKLLLAFHGSGQSAQNMQSMTQFEAYSDDYLVVYPSSKEVEWDDGCGCNIAHRLGANDAEFIVNIIARMHQEYNLIAGENYAVGFSQGGLFSQNMLCKHSELFKGVASVAASMSRQLAASCQISQPTHYLMVHGELDSVLPYEGLTHDNFGLISSPAAMALIAEENQIQTPSVQSEVAANIMAITYSNEQQITNQLLTIKGGRHQWSHTNLATSKEVLRFFNHHSKYNFEQGSSLYQVGESHYHVRTLGESNNNADIVLLSGANKYFHSDSAWSALVHKQLAKLGRVHVIDRLGNAWSSNSEDPSLTRFATDLPDILEKLAVKTVVFVAYSNSNLATLMYQHTPNPNVETKAMVWIDPDILLPHSIELYQSGAVASLRAYREEYIEHIAAGNWNEKTAQRIENERTEIAGLIPQAYENQMDWVYYDLVTQQRLDIAKQVTRIKEMMNYHDDLEVAKSLVNSLNVPITVIDSDFERLDIAKAEGEEQAALIRWQVQGSEWSRMIASNTEGEYIPLENASHQVLFEYPDKVSMAVSVILKKNK
ncbi:alpha/beta hydrolase [Pseudoalteromonas aurantia]|uniref:Alpha/beta hydrolase n=1 Tax=Pseudoalteromonas aurantia 208 TaxID=1314867 RepID=A0ABR9E5U9_9GAMM|nr:alpha/beta hydrolase [Pseudoalteromonas aurantia]MBE0366354.1 hypothetical protein [Pseudoalteromonas aurantia 208]